MQIGVGQVSEVHKPTFAPTGRDLFMELLIHPAAPAGKHQWMNITDVLRQPAPSGEKLRYFFARFERRNAKAVSSRI